MAMLMASAHAQLAVAAQPPIVSYYTYYQDPWCTANGDSCKVQGCCDDRVVPFQTLLDPTTWPTCAKGDEAAMESVLINPIAPNEHGGLDMDYLGQFYAAGAVFYNEAGKELDWKTARGAIPCGGPNHDTPYSYRIPHYKPARNPLCVPATPPAALKQSIDALKARGVRAGVSILGGAGGDNIPLPARSHLDHLSKLTEVRWNGFLAQMRAAAEVLVSWGITHFDIDFEGGIASDLNATRLSAMLAALRFDGGVVSLTTEVGSLYAVAPLLASAVKRPDLVQLMMGDYSESLASGLSQAKAIAIKSGYPLRNFRLGVKPQCGVAVGTLATFEAALPALVSSGAGLMLWNLGRDFPCADAAHGQCGGQCAAASKAGQAPFTSAAPFAFSCAASQGWVQPATVEAV